MAANITDLNARMRALLEAPDPDNHHTALRIYGVDDDDDDAGNFNYLIEAKLYNSAAKKEGHTFVDVFEEVSNSTRMSISAIFNSVSLSGDTLIHVAASNGNADIVDLIITHFPSLLSKKNHIGDNAVHVVAKAGQEAVLQVINRKRNEFTSRHSTIYCGLTKTNVEWRDDTLKVKNKEGNTPLHEALIHRHETLAVALVRQNKEVSYFPNKEDKSAFYLAAEAGYNDCLRLMMERGSNNQNRIGKSPIHAAILGKHTATEMACALDIMLEAQPGLIDSRDEEGRTPLHFAALMGYNDGVRNLITRTNQNVMKRDKYGNLPIHLASRNGHINVIEQLLEQHYNPHELLNGKGQNILHVAAESGKYEVVIHILNHPQELNNQLFNQKDDDGNTPLHLATMKSHPKIVSALTWDKRVDLNSSNNGNLTALDAAKHINGIPTFRQQLTWSSLKAAGASKFSSGKGTQSLSSPGIDNFKDRVNTLLLVSTLIATITFAAGFTMPGGYNNSKPDVGIAAMIKHRMFHLFVFCDAIAMFTSIVVVVTLIWAQLGDNRLTNRAVSIAVRLLGIALTMMSLAFMAGVYVALSNVKWLSITILVISSLFIFVVLLLFCPLALSFTSERRFFHYIAFYFIHKLACIVGNS